jgi:hypothetical protein
VKNAVFTITARLSKKLKMDALSVNAAGLVKTTGCMMKLHSTKLAWRRKTNTN